MGYKMKGFTYSGTKQSPLRGLFGSKNLKPKNDPKNPEYLKYWRDPANRGELESKAKTGIESGLSQYSSLLAQVKAENEGGGGGEASGGKHGNEMHTGTRNTEQKVETSIEPKTGPAPKPPAPGEPPVNKKEE